MLLFYLYIYIHIIYYNYHTSPHDIWSVVKWNHGKHYLQCASNKSFCFSALSFHSLPISHYLPKVDVPSSNTTKIRASIYEWCMVRCGSKSGHQKDDMCLQQIGPRVDNKLTVPSSMVKMIEVGTYTTTSRAHESSL